MAEVKKPPSFNHSSSSYKHIYDDVFSTPRQSRQQQSSSFADDDYAEMFGSSRSNNGTWSISYSSIPVLDLPPPSEMKVRGASGVTTVAGERGGNVDYGGVFGGFGDGNVGLPDGEEMFELFNKRSKTSSKSIPRSKVKTTEATRSEILTQSQNDQSRTNVLSQSVDRLQDFEQKKNEVATKSSGEIPKETQTRDFPEVSHKLEEPIPAQTTVDEKVPVIEEGTQLDKDVYPEKQEDKHDRHISMDLGANVPIINSGVLKEPGFSASDSSDKAHVTSQAATESRNAFSQPSDSTKHFDHMNNKMHNTMTSEAVCGTDNHVIHETTSVLHEIDPTHMSNETSVTKDDAETKMDDVDMAGEQGKHSRNSSPELNASNHNSELHATSQDTRQQGKHSRNSSPELNASNHNSELHATSQDTRQPDSGAGMSKTVGDDVVIDFNARRKKGMHSRITSLDLGRHKHLYEQDGNLQKNRRFGSSQSFDASHDPHAHVKVHPSMMAPSSSVPQFFPVESHYKISENSSWKNFGADVYRGATVFSASLDEQLDANSAAGASVAALERALEEATMIIQMAKEYLERESQGSSNVRFKDTLKVKVTEDEIDEFLPSMEHVNYPPVDTNKRKFPFLKDTSKMKVAKDNQPVDEISSFQQPMIHENFVPADIEKEILSPSERKSVLDNGQPPPISDDMIKVFDIVPELRDQMKSAKDEGCMEDSIMHDNSSTTSLEEERTSLLETGQPALVAEDPLKFVEDDAIHDGKRFAQDEGCIEKRNSNISKLTDERDSQEGGGEWEAAKHLNQLLCGVKNKIASFMAWQSDTEKKEELKETETCIRSQLQSEEGEPDLRDVEHADVKTVEKNEDNTGSLEEHVEMEIGFLSETVEPDENQSFGHNTAEQQKASSSVDSNPVVAASAAANYLFTPFRNEGVSAATDSDEEGHIVSEEVIETASMTVRENMLNEMKYEQLQGKCSEQNHEPLDNTFITQDSVEQADQYRHIDSDIEEIDEIMEEPHSVASKDKNEPTTNEDATRSLDENCRRDAINDPHSPELIARRVDENGNCEEHEVTKETENRQHDVQPVEEEVDLEGEITQCTKAFGGTCGIPEIERDEIQPSNTEESTCETHGQNEFMTDDTLTDQSGKTEMVAEEANFSDEVVSMKTESNCIEMIGEEKAEKTSFMSEAEDEYTNTAKEHTENTIEQVAQHAACVAADANHSLQTEDVSLCEAERPCRNDESGAKIEEAVSSDEIAIEASFNTKAEDEHTEIKNVHNEDIIEQVAEQAACFATMEDDCQLTGNEHLSEAEGPGRNDHSSVEVEEAVSSDEEEDEGRMTENACPLSDPESIKEEAVLFYDSFTELDVTENLDEKKTLQVEDSVLHSSQSDVYHEEEEITANIMDTESRDVLDDQTEHLLDPKESPNVEEATNNGQEMDTSGVDAAVLRRRRWFDNGVKLGPVERPSILEGGITEMESDQEALDESVQTGSVEIHADKLDSDRPEVIYSEVTTPAVNQDSGSVHSESTPKRKRWSVKIGEEGLPVPPPLFQGVNVNLEDPENSVKETLLHSRSEGSLDKLNAKSGEAVNATETSVDVNGGKDKSSVEATPRRKRWFGSGENVKRASLFRNEDDVGVTVGIDQSEVKEDIDSGKLEKMPTEQEPEVEHSKVEPVNDRHLDEVNRKEKEKLAVERAIREARERAFAEAKQRARRDASERSNVDARQKVAAGAQDRAGKVPAEAHTSSDKASMDAKLRAERAAVERATAEARERALQKALSEKASQRTREQAGRFPAEKNTSSDPSFQSSSSSSRVDSSNKGEKYDGFDSVSGQRRKERLERRSRTSERPATVLEEKNQRDLLVQKEQAAKNMMADSLDAEVKRWSAGKEGNLRLLLSTLQYILSPESGWQAVSFTDLVEATIVRKAYKKATLCVHPDKLQQRGATIQQKYICERVFDLLKDAWSKLNPDER